MIAFLKFKFRYKPTNSMQDLIHSWMFVNYFSLKLLSLSLKSYLNVPKVN